MWGEGLQNAVQKSMKSERLKADLITNVSHDIKTPLTSIINYVDLLKREEIQNEKAQDYIRILDRKSAAAEAADGRSGGSVQSKFRKCDSGNAESEF